MLFQINKFLSGILCCCSWNDCKTGDQYYPCALIVLWHLASYVSVDVPIIFTPMGSDVILHAQNNYIYKYMALELLKADVVTGDSVLLHAEGV